MSEELTRPKGVWDHRDEVQIVDVREPYEWDAGRIEGAVHVPLNDLMAGAGAFDKDKPVVFQCRLGRRSAMATEAFLASGYDAYNMAGGIQAWVDGGLPIEPEDGQVADHSVGPDRAHP